MIVLWKLVLLTIYTTYCGSNFSPNNKCSICVPLYMCALCIFEHNNPMDNVRVSHYTLH